MQHPSFARKTAPVVLAVALAGLLAPISHATVTPPVPQLPLTLVLMASNSGFSAEGVDQWRMVPTTVPVPGDPPQDGESPPRVEDLLEARERSQVSPAHEDYPLIPGCKPVAGKISRLPLSDQGHHLGSRGICLPAQWVDSFFATDEDDFHAARTLLRVVSFARVESGEHMSTGTLFNARISLPHTGERLSLILRSDDKEDDRLGEREDIEQDADTGILRAALRWVAIQTRFLTGDLDSGIRDGDPYVRSRFRLQNRFGEHNWARLSQEFYWRGNDERRGLATEFELGRALTPDSAIQLNTLAESNTLLRREGINWRWSQSASWFVRLAKRSAIQTRIRVRGRTEPNYRTDSWQASTRLRHSFWRPWLYYEVEPFLLALRENDFEQTPGLMVRLEVQFGAYR